THSAQVRLRDSATPFSIRHGLGKFDLSGKLDFKGKLAISGNVRAARRQIPRQLLESNNFSGLAG
ncbi:MAG: hypothetical protein WA773_02640, partial [Bradyrhizobium sp.]